MVDFDSLFSVSSILLKPNTIITVRIIKYVFRWYVGFLVLGSTHNTHSHYILVDIQTRGDSWIFVSCRCWMGINNIQCGHLLLSISGNKNKCIKRGSATAYVRVDSPATASRKQVCKTKLKILRSSKEKNCCLALESAQNDKLFLLFFCTSKRTALDLLRANVQVAVLFPGYRRGAHFTQSLCIPFLCE